MAFRKLDDALSEQRALVNGIVPLKLNNKQKSQWEMTRSALLWNCPAFTHILYTLMSQDDGEVALFTDAIPRAATDGATMLLNPEWFFKLSLQHRVFVAAHEICHAIFDHCGQAYMHRKRGFVQTPGGKKLDFNDKLMNIAQDLIINDLLIESKVGTFVAEGIHDTSRGTSVDSMIDVYEKIYEEAKKGGPGPGGVGFDDHLDPGTSQGKDPTQAAQERSPIEWANAVAAGIAQAKAQGKLPGAMERVFGELLEPEVSWQDKIQSFFNRKVGSGSYDWRRPDRNLIVRDPAIYAPGRSGFGAGHVVVAIDTSGSIGDAELSRFFAELQGILADVRPKKMSVIWCDAKVHKVDEVYESEDVGGLKPHGGGGTDFRPVFEWVEANCDGDVDALVYLTDLYGSFPSSAPAYPVLWGDIMCGKGVQHPWGDVVHIPIKR